MVFSTTSFARVSLEKRFELKSLKTTTEELRGPVPELLSLRLSLKAL